MGMITRIPDPSERDAVAELRMVLAELKTEIPYDPLLDEPIFTVDIDERGGNVAGTITPYRGLGSPLVAIHFLKGGTVIVEHDHGAIVLSSWRNGITVLLRHLDTCLRSTAEHVPEEQRAWYLTQASRFIITLSVLERTDTL